MKNHVSIWSKSHNKKNIKNNYLAIQNFFNRKMKYYNGKAFLICLYWIFEAFNIFDWNGY